MIKICLALLVTISTVCVQSQTLQGSLTAHAGQEISLIGFTYETFSEMAKTKIDSLGNFTLQYPKDYKGMAVLKTQDKSSLVFVLVEPNLVLTGKNLRETASLVFKNGKENANFLQYAKEHQQRNSALAAWKYLLPIYKEQALFAKHNNVRNFIKKEEYRIEIEDDSYLKNLPSTSYMRWFLPLRKLVEDMPAVVSKYTERIPVTINQFRTINLAHANFKNSGLFKELIEGHYMLLENMGQSTDSITAQMNLSTHYLIENFKDSKQMLNRVSENLFNLFEKRSLFKASEFLALTLLEEEHRLLSPKFAHKLEGYRKLKVGNIAPDIQLDATTKLSSIQKPTVLVFVASWCPDCKLTNEKLNNFYASWKTKKSVEIIYISIDTDKKAFNAVYANSPWAVYANFKGWESEAVKKYHVIGTPSYFVLDKNRKIISRPKSVEQIDAIVNYSL
jgi:thiol-disulfide isomerase/thioredoxin